MTIKALAKVLADVKAGQSVVVELVSGSTLNLVGPQAVDGGGLVTVVTGRATRYFEAQDVATVVVGRAPETKGV